MIFGKQLTKIFSKRANPPKRTHVPGENQSEKKQSGPRKKIRKKTMKPLIKKTASYTRQKTAKKKRGK